MPTYDYLCEANGQIVEVKHRMSENVQTWGELCQLTGREAGDTDVKSPVKRLATGGNVVKSTGAATGGGHACSSGSCCSGGMCGLSN